MADPTIEVVSGVVMDASEACTQTYGIIAAKKGGKTYLGGRFFEQLYAAQAPFLAIDPVGHWSALTLAADGKSPGLSIVVIGGQRADVPLDIEQAEPVARYLVDSGISAVVDVSELRREQRSQYVARFGDEVFAMAKRVRRAMLVGFDEFQDVAPQAGDKWARRALLMATDVVRIGRNYGLGSLMLTQRPESVSKEALNQIECMFVGGLRGPQERKTIQGWLSHKKADVRAQLEELPSLKPGEFFLWSPSWLEKFERVRALPKWTYDSSATPKLGAVRIAPTARSKRDVADFVSGLEKLGKKPVAVDVPSSVGWIEVDFRKKFETLDEDNENLAARLAEAEREKAWLYAELEQLRHRLERTEVALVGLRDGVVAHTQRLEAELGVLVNRALDVAGHGLEVPFEPEPPTSVTPARRERREPSGDYETRKEGQPVVERRSKAPAGGGSQGVGKPEALVLGVLAQQPGPIDKNRLALLAGYSPTGGGFSNTLSRLRVGGLIDSSTGLYAITREGRRKAPKVEALPTGYALIEYWKGHRRMDACMRAIFLTLAGSVHPLTKQQLGAKTGYSPTAGGFNNAMSRLRTLGLIVGKGSSPIRLSPALEEAARQG